MKRALLIGREPEAVLGYTYVVEPPYEAVVLGSLTLGELLCFREERTLTALAAGQPVVLYSPGLPEAKNRAMAATLAAKRRELKSWGVVFTDGCRRHLVTAQEASRMRSQGLRPEPGAVLTPLAKEILEGKE
jgi:hypothetical protein